MLCACQWAGLVAISKFMSVFKFELGTEKPNLKFEYMKMFLHFVSICNMGRRLNSGFALSLYDGDQVIMSEYASDFDLDLVVILSDCLQSQAETAELSDSASLSSPNLKLEVSPR
jgi:hypothetical protein